jgi:hypothetical protein
MRHRSPRALVGAVAAVAFALALPATASAEPAVGVVESTLMVFDTATPGQVDEFVPISGLPAGQRIIGLDYRYFPGPAGGPPSQSPELAALAVNGDGTGTTAQLYSLDAPSRSTEFHATGLAFRPDL